MSCVIGAAEAGATLLDFLCARFSYHDRAGWSALIGVGALLVNGEEVGSDARLGEGALVTYRPSGASEPYADRAVKVLYEDGDILLVSKTGNLTVHPGGKYFRNTLWGVLREELGVKNPAIINRLDRETSGVTLVAKNPEAAAACRAQFTARGVFKKYIAVTEGALERPLRCRGYMLPCEGSAVNKKLRFEPSTGEGPEPGKEPLWADTGFAPLGRRGELGLVEAVPHTGRTHQIRASLLALGLPLVGDKIYGVDEEMFLRFIADSLTPEDARRLRLGRQALHAAELRFRHPATGREISAEAPLPADMAALIGGDL